MAGAAEIRVHGLRELQLDLKRIGKEANRALRAELEAAASPVRFDAEVLARSNISHIGPKWSRMRVGVTPGLVYVAPVSKRHGGSPRSNLAGLLMDKAMQPALTRNEGQIIARIDQMLGLLVE